MKITSFNPLIVTKNAAETIKLFEELGFEVKHTIRMNVRDFDEAFEFLTSKGFKNAQGDRITDTGSSKATMMVSPSGFAINLIEHIRKD